VAAAPEAARTQAAIAAAKGAVDRAVARVIHRAADVIRTLTSPPERRARRPDSSRCVRSRRR
jgi:hypothetical protein